jgi:hypothetical protein
MHDAMVHDGIAGVGPSTVQSIVEIADKDKSGSTSTTTVTNVDGMVTLTLEEDSGGATGTGSFTSSTTKYTGVPNVDGSIITKLWWSDATHGVDVVTVLANHSDDSSVVIDVEAEGVIITTNNYADGTCSHSVAHANGSPPSASKIHHDGRLHAIMDDGSTFIVGGKPNCTAHVFDHAAHTTRNSESISFAGKVLRWPLMLFLLFALLMGIATAIALLIDGKVKTDSGKGKEPTDQEKEDLLAQRFGGIITSAQDPTGLTLLHTTYVVTHSLTHFPIHRIGLHRREHRCSPRLHEATFSNTLTRCRAGLVSAARSG